MDYKVIGLPEDLEEKGAGGHGGEVQRGKVYHIYLFNWVIHILKLDLGRFNL